MTARIHCRKFFGICPWALVADLSFASFNKYLAKPLTMSTMMISQHGDRISSDFYSNSDVFTLIKFTVVR